MYPPLAQLRAISRAIAAAVAREAIDSGVARADIDDADAAVAAVAAAIWVPDYAGPGY